MRHAPILLAIFVLLAASRGFAQTRFTIETFALRPGERLDLDTGALLRTDRGGLRAELVFADGAVRALLPTSDGLDLAAVLPPASTAWQKTATDVERIGWFEVVRVDDGIARLRVVIRSAGTNAPSAAPAEVRALAHADGVELRWSGARDTRRWLVERADTGGAFETVAEVEEPRFVNSLPAAGARHRYRIAALDRAGDGGLPTHIVIGNPLPRGAMEFAVPGGADAGRIPIDLLTGTRVDAGLADVILSGSSLRDSFGLPAASPDRIPPAGSDLWRVWCESAAATADGNFLAPLRDGGFALGSLRSRRGGDMVLRWVVVEGGDVLPTSADLRGLVTTSVALAHETWIEPGQGSGRDGAQPAAADRQVQEWLFSRQRHDDYEVATFSFEHGRRDDPENRITHNDWDLQFGNGADRFHVRMVTDDVSQIGVVPATDWHSLTPDVLDGLLLDAEVGVREGEFYAVRTCDTETDLVALFRVARLLPGDACLIEWVALVHGQRVASSPGLDPAAVAKAGAVLGRLAETVATRRFPLDDVRRKTLDALADRRFVVDSDPTVGWVLDAVEARVGAIDVTAVPQGDRLRARCSARAPYVAEARSLEAALEAVLRHNRCRWWIGSDGRVVIAPR
jgi:hypothetical protein